MSTRTAALVAISRTDSHAHPRQAPDSTPSVADGFKGAFRHHPGGVALITADAGDGPVAFTASSVASVSVDPPILMFSASAQSSSSPTVIQASTLVVHFLTADDLDLAQLGSTPGIDRFGDTSRWRRLPTGEPFFPSAHAWIRAKTIRRVDAAGSMVILCEALEAGSCTNNNQSTQDGLVYINRTWHRLTENTLM